MYTNVKICFIAKMNNFKFRNTDKIKVILDFNV